VFFSDESGPMKTAALLDRFPVPLKRGLINGISITFEMVKVIVPCYIVIEFLRHVGLIDSVSRFFRPFMSFFGLPGESALGLMAGYFINLYAAIAVLTPLQLSAKDMTVIALMLGIAHSLPVETPVTRKTGVNAWLLLAVRIILSLLTGVVLKILWKLF
jgi:hypothetical protein